MNILEWIKTYLVKNLAISKLKRNIDKFVKSDKSCPKDTVNNSRKNFGSKLNINTKFKKL